MVHGPVGLMLDANQIQWLNLERYLDKEKSALLRWRRAFQLEPRSPKIYLGNSIFRKTDCYRATYPIGITVPCNW